LVQNATGQGYQVKILRKTGQSGVNQVCTWSIQLVYGAAARLAAEAMQHPDSPRLRGRRDERS
jgi:hypothetical protein